MKKWLQRLRAMPLSQRVLIGVGVPVVAVAALMRRGQDPPAEGSSGLTVSAASGINTLDTAAVGVSSGQLGAFANSFTEEIGLIESRLELIEGRRADIQARNPVGIPDHDQARIALGEPARNTDGVKNSATAQTPTVRVDPIPTVKNSATAQTPPVHIDPIPTVKNSTTATHVHTVKRGDTLWAIAQRFCGSGSKWPTILAQNPGSVSRPGDVRTLRVGYTLRFSC